ncbi:MAG TPA: hypothetical protein VH637_12195 [Streptosporangiaceae bacterium]|jgi:hypothetical protein
MYVTTITLIDNRSPGTIQLFGIDGGAPSTVTVGPGQTIPVSVNVPWALDASATGFAVHHLELRFGSTTKFWIWQYGNSMDGNHVRFSVNGSWNAFGRPVHGISAVDALDGTRTMVVRASCFELTDFPVNLVQTITTALGPGKYRMTGQFGDRPVPSVPKSTATAVSMAGPPSDALALGQAGAQWLYRDEGKRYRFVLAGGVVTAIEPDGNQIPLTAAVSHSTLRAGETYTAPPFDLIAANGGRVFAKQQGTDRFYFATMDHMLVGAADDGSLISVPSNYFKLDPQFGQAGALTTDLTQPFEGCFGGHPGAERFPLFQFALAQNLVDAMMVLLQPRVWHLADTRPPVGEFNLELLGLKTMLEYSPLGALMSVPVIEQWLAPLGQAVVAPGIAPPAGVPTYPAADYAFGPGAVTCWVDTRAQHVAFVPADGQVRELRYPLGTGPWALNNPSAAAGAPVASGGLTSLVEPAWEHVFFVSAIGHVNELFCPAAGGTWARNDLTAGTGAPLATSMLTSWVDPAYRHVVFASADGHVHELYCGLAAGSSWAHNDLTTVTGAPPSRSPAQLTSWVDSRYQHVVFASADGHLHELYYNLTAGGWGTGDLTASTGGPAAAGRTGTLASWADASFQHVAFVSVQQHVHELRFALATGPWTATDLTVAAGAPQAGGQLTSWQDPSVQHLAFVGADGHVHELYAALGTESWVTGDLTAQAGAPQAAAGSPLGSWVDPVDQHVVFASADGHVHELFFTLGQGPWQVNDLTQLTGGPTLLPPFGMPAIDFDQVLDIGVGHVHWHEQYDHRTGGEIQPLFTGPFLQTPPLTYADLYRFTNGPVRDADGFIDGTCNYYALVHLRGAGFALLYIDEQSYFVQRWRMADPRDANGLSTALVGSLASNASFYGWNPATFWDPFRAGQIAATSRMAVSRQVVLVSAPDPLKPGQPAAVIYSINFSYATMDRSWRWRSLPGQARYFTSDAQRASEPIDPSLADTVYPETIRLREDMTVNVKGTRLQPDGTIVVGRWYQRYLPAGNALVPPASALTGSRPAQGYSHPWKFLPEAVFLAADQFSHLGVYAAVDSRTQFYTVTPATAQDTYQLTMAMGDNPWIDTGRQLCTRLLEFQWAAPLRLPDVDPGQTLWNLEIVGYPRAPASLFNTETRLRIVRNGPAWLAQHWDKRDDDLISFWGLPVTVTLTKDLRNATVTLNASSWDDTPPAVVAAGFTWTGNPKQPVQISLTSPQSVSRVRLAALDPVPDPSSAGSRATVVTLLDVPVAGYFTSAGPGEVFSWSPGARVQALLARYCTQAGVLAHGTSLWCEDLAGHASPPDSMAWAGTPPALNVTGQLWHTIRNPDGTWAAADSVNGHISVAGPVISAAAASTAAGQVEMAYSTEDGRLWHTVRNPDGTWAAADNLAAHILIIGAVTSVTAACSAAGQLGLIYTTADGSIWQAVRSASGTWGSPENFSPLWGSIGAITAIAATSCDPSQTQLMFATREGGLWHSIQLAGGSWTLPPGDVHGQIGNPGVVTAIAAAGAAPGTSAFMIATVDGGLWHTMRKPDGTWTGLGDVKGQIGDPGAVTGVAAAGSGPGVVQFLFTTADGNLWHTIRQANGTWTGLAASRARSATGAR